MRTKTTTIYIAYDGTEFEDKEEYEQYEKTSLLDHLSSNCIFLDSDQKPVSNEEFFNDPVNVRGIYAPNARQAEIIHQILDKYMLASPWNGCDCYASGFYWWCDYNDGWGKCYRESYVLAKIIQ